MVELHAQEFHALIIYVLNIHTCSIFKEINFRWPETSENILPPKIFLKTVNSYEQNNGCKKNDTSGSIYLAESSWYDPQDSRNIMFLAVSVQQ